MSFISVPWGFPIAISTVYYLNNRAYYISRLLEEIWYTVKVNLQDLFQDFTPPKMFVTQDWYRYYYAIAESKTSKNVPFSFIVVLWVFYVKNFVATQIFIFVCVLRPNVASYSQLPLYFFSGCLWSLHASVFQASLIF